MEIKSWIRTETLTNIVIVFYKHKYACSLESSATTGGKKTLLASPMSGGRILMSGLFPVLSVAGQSLR